MSPTEQVPCPELSDALARCHSELLEQDLVRSDAAQADPARVPHRRLRLRGLRRASRELDPAELTPRPHPALRRAAQHPWSRPEHLRAQARGAAGALLQPASAWSDRPRTRPTSSSPRPRPAARLPRVLSANEGPRGLLDSIPASSPLELRELRARSSSLAYSSGPARGGGRIAPSRATSTTDAEELRVEGKGRKTRVLPAGRARDGRAPRVTTRPRCARRSPTGAENRARSRR